MLAAYQVLVVIILVCQELDQDNAAISELSG